MSKKEKGRCEGGASVLFDLIGFRGDIFALAGLLTQVRVCISKGIPVQYIALSLVITAFG